MYFGSEVRYRRTLLRCSLSITCSQTLSMDHFSMVVPNNAYVRAPCKSSEHLGVRPWQGVIQKHRSKETKALHMILLL